MKKLNYISGIFTGIVATVAVFLLVSHTPAGEPSVPRYSGRITSINSNTDVYRLTGLPENQANPLFSFRIPVV